MSARDVLANATPRPWVLVEHSPLYDGPTIGARGVLSECSVFVAEGSVANPADMALATRAVNEYEALLAIAGVLKEIADAGCRVGWGNHPPASTCLDVQAHASDPSNRYGDEYRARLISGEELCIGCRATVALARLDAVRAGETTCPSVSVGGLSCMYPRGHQGSHGRSGAEWSVGRADETTPESDGYEGPLRVEKATKEYVVPVSPRSTEPEA